MPVFVLLLNFCSERWKKSENLKSWSWIRRWWRIWRMKVWGWVWEEGGGGCVLRVFFSFYLCFLPSNLSGSKFISSPELSLLCLGQYLGRDLTPSQLQSFFVFPSPLSRWGGGVRAQLSRHLQAAKVSPCKGDTAAVGRSAWEGGVGIVNCDRFLWRKGEKGVRQGACLEEA